MRLLEWRPGQPSRGRPLRHCRMDSPDKTLRSSTRTRSLLLFFILDKYVNYVFSRGSSLFRNNEILWPIQFMVIYSPDRVPHGYALDSLATVRDLKGTTNSWEGGKAGTGKPWAVIMRSRGDDMIDVCIMMVMTGTLEQYLNSLTIAYEDRWRYKRMIPEKGYVHISGHQNF